MVKWTISQCCACQSRELDIAVNSLAKQQLLSATKLQAILLFIFWGVKKRGMTYNEDHKLELNWWKLWPFGVLEHVIRTFERWKFMSGIRASPNTLVRNKPKKYNVHSPISISFFIEKTVANNTWTWKLCAVTIWLPRHKSISANFMLNKCLVQICMVTRPIFVKSPALVKPPNLKFTMVLVRGSCHCDSCSVQHE